MDWAHCETWPNHLFCWFLWFAPCISLLARLTCNSLLYPQHGFLVKFVVRYFRCRPNRGVFVHPNDIITKLPINLDLVRSLSPLPHQLWRNQRVHRLLRTLSNYTRSKILEISFAKSARRGNETETRIPMTIAVVTRSTRIAACASVWQKFIMMKCFMTIVSYKRDFQMIPTYRRHCKHTETGYFWKVRQEVGDQLHSIFWSELIRCSWDRFVAQIKSKRMSWLLTSTSRVRTSGASLSMIALN